MKIFIKTLSLLAIIVLLFSSCSLQRENSNDLLNTEQTIETTTQTTTIKPSTTKKLTKKDLLPKKPKLECTINTVGGITIYWKTIYTGKKKVNYYTVNFHMYDPVGEDAYDEITGKCTFSLKYVGPIKKGGNIGAYSEYKVYSGACAKIQIETIEFEFADGTYAEIWYGWETTCAYDLY